MAAHRYWRLMVRGAASTPGVGELQMRTSIGGTNVATGGTPSASSSQGAYTADKAFNGITNDTGSGNGWFSNSTTGSDGIGSWPWLQYDFGAGNEKDIAEIVIFAPGSAGVNVGNMPTAWSFQWSDDGVKWTTQRAYAFDSATAAWTLLSSRVYDVRPLGAIDVHNYVLFREVRAGNLTPPAGQPVAPGTVTPVPLEFTTFYWQAWRGGLYRLAGTTTVLGFPGPRRVRLHAQNDGRVVAEQVTQADGLFEFRNIDIGPWIVMGIDDTGTQNGIIYTHVKAVPM